VLDTEQYLAHSLREKNNGQIRNSNMFCISTINVRILEDREYQWRRELTNQECMNNCSLF
jgi:hypothetical protein